MRRLRRIVGALFPDAAIAAAALAALFVEGGALRILDLTATYGLVVYGVGMALAWVFHRSRVFVLLACLALLDLAWEGAGGGDGRLVAYGTVLVALAGVLAPTRDRGVPSRAGLAQVTLGAIAVAGVATALRDPAGLAAFITPVDVAPALSLWPGLPRATVVAAVLGACGAAFAFWRWRGPVDRALLWSVVLFVVALHPSVGPSRTALLLVAAGLVLTLSVVETSVMLAYRDDLTGLLGRRALMQQLDGMGGTWAVAMVDVDHFKKFNDRHGHDVGDQVLQMVASKLERAPGGARAYRYGGEEFTLLFPGHTKETATPHLEAVRRTIAASGFTLRSWRRPRGKPKTPKSRGRSTKKPRQLKVTVSLGVADSTRGDAAPEAVLKRADKALYRAKKNGRNRVSA